MKLAKLPRLVCKFTGDIFTFDSDEGDYVIFPALSHAPYKRVCRRAVSIKRNRNSIEFTDEYGDIDEIHVKSFPAEWVKMFKEKGREYVIEIFSNEHTKKQNDTSKKVYLGWGISETNAIFCAGSISWLTIFDHDLRMGSSNEKIIFTQKDLAVEQLRAMRKLQKTKHEWQAFGEFKLVRLYKTV